MGLQVWLPLSGNTKQQGLSNIAMTGSPSSWVNGKIGQCAHFTGNVDNAIYNNTTDFNYTDNFSWAVWIKTNFTGTTAQYVFTNGRADTGGYGYGIQCVSSANCYVRFGNQSYTIPVTGGEWTHLAFTKKGTLITIYKNGSVHTSQTFNGTLPTYSDGNGLGLGCFHYSYNIYPFYGDINDFRIYDHVLSPREVKEIAKGLVLHYPLAMPGQENLVTGSNTNSTSTNKWFGHSAVGGNTSTIEVDETGTNCVKVTRDSTAQSSWDFLSYDALLKNQLKTNTVYTVSFDAKPSVDGTITLNGFMNGNATNNMTASIAQVQSSLLANKWNHCVYHCTTLDSFDGITISGQVVYLLRSTSLKGINTTVLFKNIKVEEGEIATPWVPNPADTAYTALGFNDGIEYDVSGFQYNGEKYGDLKWSNNSAKYNACYEFDGSSDYIRLKQDLYSQFRLARDEVTVNIWAYKDDWDDYKNSGSTSQWMTMCGCQEGGGFSIYEVGNGRFTFVCGTGASSNSYKVSNTATGYADSLSAGWHMFTLTFDGLSLKGYVDGNLVVSNAFFTTKTPIYYNTGTTSIYIGVESGSGNQAGLWWKGKLSDFRVYTTALPAEDVLELYHAPITLANNGTLLTQGEFVES